ncbi:hypothetical protein [Pseudomonas japonica]|uniref:hypothetical protein n=1 Tax=Pseudomonas japonica TaxID=256466 RepID=UPI003A8BF9BE
MKRPAYLEISPRQTGKTERLITLAQGRQDAGRNVCFTTRQKEEIQRRLPGALVLGPKGRFPASLNPDDYDWFFDEFDWLKTAEFVDGGFYSTTPRFLRAVGADPAGDLLLELLQASGNVLTRNYWSFDMADVLREARGAYSESEFRRFYLGEFYE